MKKTTAFSVSSLLLLGGVSYLAAKLADLDLTFFFDGDDDHAHYAHASLSDRQKAGIIYREQEGHFIYYIETLIIMLIYAVGIRILMACMVVAALRRPAAPASGCRR